MTADDKHFFLNRDNLTLPIQMHLCQKQKTFSEFFCEFLKSTLIFKTFQKKGSSVTGLFRHLPKHHFRSPQFRK